MYNRESNLKLTSVGDGQKRFFTCTISDIAETSRKENQQTLVSGGQRESSLLVGWISGSSLVLCEKDHELDPQHPTRKSMQPRSHLHTFEKESTVQKWLCL